MSWWETVLGVGAALYAGLTLMLYIFQERQIYYPDIPSREVDVTPAAIGLVYEAVQINTGDGETLTGWFVPATAARGTVLFFHGNAGNIGHRLDPIMVLHRIGLNVFIIDYRGYGASTGKPTEAGTYRDADAAWNYLTQIRGLPARRIVLFGESLGGAVAARLATRVEPGALAIFGGFTSVPDLAQQLFPIFPARWLARYRYDTREALRDIQAPVLILHSREDEIIPYSHGEALFAAAQEPKQMIDLKGGHNEAMRVSRETYAQGMTQFLDRVLPKL